MAGTVVDKNLSTYLFPHATVITRAGSLALMVRASGEYPSHLSNIDFDGETGQDFREAMR